MIDCDSHPFVSIKISKHKLYFKMIKHKLYFFIQKGSFVLT